MNLADFLRQGPMGQQRQANDSSFNRDADLARMSQSYGSVQAPFMDRLSTGQVPTYTGNPNDVLADSLILGDEFNRQRDAKQSEQLMNMMPGAGITAWHGSPHKFSKFDMSKIGTGEGAQAYGHGLYTAENPKVAKEYADELTREIRVGENIIQGKGHQVGSTGLEDVDDYLIANRGDANLALSNMKKDRLEVANSKWRNAMTGELLPNRAKSYDAGIEMLEGLVKRGEVQNTTAGNLYKVDIPDDQIAKMLDWDAPLSKSFVKREPGTSPSREQALSRAAVKEGRAGEGYYEDLIDLYGEGGRVPRNMAQQEVSEYLRLQGIPGIKYLDGGSRSGGQGTSNFVLFSDEIAEILERNGQPLGDLAEGLKNR